MKTEVQGSLAGRALVTRWLSVDRRKRMSRTLRLLLVVVLLLCWTARCRCLTCHVCARKSFIGQHTSQQHKFRVSMSMPTPYCRQLEQVECDRDHNVCLKETVDMGDEDGWWVGMGCGLRSDDPFDRPQAYQHYGCQEIRFPSEEVVVDRNTRRRNVNSADRFHTVCVCQEDNCNAAPRPAVAASRASVIGIAAAACLFAFASKFSILF